MAEHWEKRQNTECQDWEIVWYEYKEPCDVATCDSGNCETPRCHRPFHYRKKKVCNDRTDCPCRRKLCTSQQHKKSAGMLSGSRFGVKHFPLEVGSLGFTNGPNPQKLFQIPAYPGPISNKEISNATDDIPKTALRATFTIWLARTRCLEVGVGRKTWSANNNAAGEGRSPGPRRLSQVGAAEQADRMKRQERLKILDFCARQIKMSRQNKPGSSRRRLWMATAWC